MSDLISRQAAIDALDSIGSLDTDADRKYARGIFNALPSAEPKWIPVKQALPAARRSVIISTKDWTGEGCYWETTEHHVIWKGYRWNATYWDDEVLAWMPLPKPYQKKGEK